MSKSKFKFIPILAMLVIVMLEPPVHAANLDSNWSTSAPTIDGLITAGEWDDAYINNFWAISDLDLITPIQVFMFAMNNGSYLYLRIQWNDPDHDAVLDYVIICFDEDNDGNISQPGMENAFYYRMNNTYSDWRDGYFSISEPDLVAVDIGSKDGSAAYSYTAGLYVVEVSFPIGSADAEDIQTNAGDTIGIAICFDLGNLDTYWYPLDTTFYLNSTSFQLASAPSSDDGIGTPLSLVFLLSTIILIAIFRMRQTKGIKFPKRS